jgi:hypothetical protein
MPVQLTSENFQVRYSPEEDRLLLTVDISAENAVGIPLTRRLTRVLVGALAETVTKQREESAKKSVALTDPSLNQEHKRIVEEGFAKGQIRKNVPVKPLASAPKRANGFKIEERADGAAAIVLDNGDLLLTLRLAPDGVHAAMSVLLNQAAAAGWDFPPITEWLEIARQKQTPAGEARSVH